MNIYVILFFYVNKFNSPRLYMDPSDGDDKLRKLCEMMHNLQLGQQKLEIQLLEVNNKLDVIQKSTTHMDSHIDLVDGVYNNVKDPFFAVMDYAGSVLNTKAIEDNVES